MNLKRLIALIIFLLLIIGGVLGFNIYNRIYKPNTVQEGYLLIPTDSSFEELEDKIRPFLKRVKPFKWVAEKKKFTQSVKPGRYKIDKGMNNNELINLLRSGNQSPIRIAFNNQDTFEKLAGRIAREIEADSVSLLSTFKAWDFYAAEGINKENALAMYLPNTYEFFWNTSADQFRARMLKEYKAFWTASNKNKAKAQNLSPLQVITLASIVQKETASVEERPMVAKLYLNRLKSGWPLQADPTVIFAYKKKYGQDASIKRVLNKDLKIKSPYNTYINQGLPPGPIGMPDLSSINAVLNPANHNYYYMCVNVDDLGKHAFAETLKQHNINARKYQNWLNKQGIRR